MSQETEEILGRVIKLISNMNILDRRTYKPPPSLRRVLGGVINFRRYLFENDIEMIKKALESKEVVLSQLDNLMARLGSLKKDGKYVSKSSFARNYRGKLKEILVRKEGTIYADVLRRTSSIFQEKMDEVINVTKDGEVDDSTIFWLFLACFVIASINTLISENKTFEEIRDNVINEFYVDFMYGFSYVESKAHTILDIKKVPSRIFKRLKLYLVDRDSLYERYRELKGKLRSEGFKFDLSSPVIRENYRGVFNDNWDSIILFAYPEASRGYELILTTQGVTTRYRRRASILYIEIMVSRQSKRFIVVINRPISKLGRRYSMELDVIKTILDKIFDIDYSDLINRAKIFEVNAEKALKLIVEALEYSPRRSLVNALNKFQDKMGKRLTRIIKKEKLQYQEQLLELVSKLILSRMYVELQYERRTVMSIEVELSPPKHDKLYNDIGLIAEDIKRVVNTALNRFYGTLEPKPVYGIRFRSSIGDEEVEIEFNTLGDIYFHGLRRDYATELSYVLSKALR